MGDDRSLRSAHATDSAPQYPMSVDGAYAAWRHGDIAPWRITLALNARGLYGPEVDRACGVEEPAVDEWEAGRAYPTFDQLLALATLTEYPVWSFIDRGSKPLTAADTSMRFHVRMPKRPVEPVMRFELAAINWTLSLSDDDASR